MSDPSDLAELEAHLSDVALSVFAAGTVAATLHEIVGAAERTVEGCVAAGLLTIEAGAPSTSAASNALAVTLDQLQIAADEGPCLDAVKAGTTFYAEDVRCDARWPTFGLAAAGVDVRSVLACSLAPGGLSALNLYGERPNAFGPTARAQAQLFATLASLALGAAHQHATDERQVENLHEALRTREVIGQAQGILMERERITAEQAFAVLRRASQRMNIKLRAVAEALVETGESPNEDAAADR